MAPNLGTFPDIEGINVGDVADLTFPVPRQCDVKLIGLIKGLLAEVASLRSEVDGLKEDNAGLKAILGEDLKAGCEVVTKDIEELKVDGEELFNQIQSNKVNIGKVEQYSRRGTLTVIGCKMSPNEDVTQKVIDVLSTESVKLVPGDFEAVHRNGNKDTEYVRPSDQKKFINPPSITVRFTNLGKKDKVQRAYKNYSNNRPKQVRVYQSLTPYYKSLKNEITEYFKKMIVKVSWIHWRSATAGMVVKLDNGRLLKNIFCFKDCKVGYLGCGAASEEATR